MKFVYIAGPYMGTALHHDHRSYSEIDRNIAQARDALASLAQAGVGAFCPHTHSAHFESIVPDVPPSYWYELDIYFLQHCDAILMLPRWEESTGARKEKGIAEAMLMPVFYTLEEAIEWASETSSLQEQPAV